MWRGVTIMFLPPRRRPGWEGPGWRGNGSCRHPHTLDFPFEYDPRMRLHRRAHFLAQRLDIGAGRTAEVEQEVAMFLAHLRVAAAQATAPRGVDQCPRLMAVRVLESRAAGARPQRLRGFALGGDPRSEEH